MIGASCTCYSGVFDGLAGGVDVLVEAWRGAFTFPTFEIGTRASSRAPASIAEDQAAILSFLSCPLHNILLLLFLVSSLACISTCPSYLYSDPSIICSDIVSLRTGSLRLPGFRAMEMTPPCCKPSTIHHPPEAELRSPCRHAGGAAHNQGELRIASHWQLHTTDDGLRHCFPDKLGLLLAAALAAFAQRRSPRA